MIRTTVAVATYNTAEMTKRCVERIIECSDMETTEIIVVDDGSTDNTVEVMRSLPVRLAIMGKNIGYPAAMNHALPLSDALHYFVTVNSDVLVCPGWLEKFDAEFQKNRKLGVCGVAGTPCTLDAQGNGHRGTRIDYVEGSCAMYSKRALNFTGFYDPAYRRCYFEDSDLCLRIQKAGYETALIPLDIKHIGQASMGPAQKAGLDVEGFHAYNRRVFMNRWGDYLKGIRNPEKILVIRHMALGDVIETTPVIAALRRDHPEATIDVETRYREVFDRNPEVRAVFQPGEASRQNYHAVFDLNNCYESTPEIHMVEAYAKKCGVKVDDWKPKLYLPRGVDRGHGFLGEYACVHVLQEKVIGRSLTKKLTDGIYAHLKSRGLGVYWIGTGPKPPLCSLAVTIRDSQLFIGADSGPMHVAMAMGTPIVAIFGATDPKLRMVPGGNWKVVTAPEREVGCLGCQHVHPAPFTSASCFRTGSDLNRCMERVRIEDVITAIDLTLEATCSSKPAKSASTF